MTVALLLLALLVGLAWLRHAVHASLAPEWRAHTRTPDSLGLIYRQVRIGTENGKHLHGWYIPQPGPAPGVVLLHGWGGNAETLMPLARPLHQAGCHLLMIDARCHGHSDEDSFASLPRFAEDLGHALDWLKAQPEVDARALAAIGHSVGAGAALLTAARRKDLAAVVSLAAFSHPKTMMRRWFQSKGIPYRPVGWLILAYVQWVIGHAFDAIAPLHTIRRITCPTLLIHGTDDDTVPVWEAQLIYASRTGDHVQLKLVDGSHDDFRDLEKDLPALLDFLTRHLRASA